MSHTFTVAVIGADGAGKSTITRRLTRELPVPCKYVYMGINLDNSKLVLPTTRVLLEIRRWRGRRPDMAGLPDPNAPKEFHRNPVMRFLAELKLVLRLSNLAGEEWFRQVVIWYYRMRGNVVLCDRHFFIENYPHDVEGTARWGFGSRIHGLMLERFYPKPEVVVFLDAPATVLLARKGEGTLGFLDDRRREYLRFQDIVENFHSVDATESEDDVTEKVGAIVQDFYARRIAIGGQAG